MQHEAWMLSAVSYDVAEEEEALVVTNASVFGQLLSEHTTDTQKSQKQQANKPN